MHCHSRTACACLTTQYRLPTQQLCVLVHALISHVPSLTANACARMHTFTQAFLITAYVCIHKYPHTHSHSQQMRVHAHTLALSHVHTYSHSQRIHVHTCPLTHTLHALSLTADACTHTHSHTHTQTPSRSEYMYTHVLSHILCIIFCAARGYVAKLEREAERLGKLAVTQQRLKESHIQ